MVKKEAGEMALQSTTLAALPGELGFDSQQPPGGSQLSVIPILGNLLCFSGLHRHQDYT